MLLFYRILILFLIIFNFRVPVLYNSAVVSIILTTFYYIFVRGSIRLDYFFHRYTVRILIGLVLLSILCFSYPVLLGTYDFILLKCFILQFFMITAMIYALPLLIEGEESDAFNNISQLICYTFAVQGFIQMSAFFIPPVGDFLIAMKPEIIQKKLFGPYELYFRGYALSGSPFFELPAGFGVAFILFFRLLLTGQPNCTSGYKGFVIFFLLLSGSIFSGRTAFIGLVMGFCMYLFLVQDRVIKILKALVKLIIPVCLILGAYNYILTPAQRFAITNHVFPFAFEFYYKYEDTGKLSTSSTDLMINKQYFMPSTQTLLHGDGRYVGLDGHGYYMETDAGYMRAILYGGIFFWIACFIYQTLFFIQPLYIAGQTKNRWNKPDFWCLMTLFVHLFILEIKAEAVGRMNIMQVLLCLICTCYLAQNYLKEYIASDLDNISFKNDENEDCILASGRAL